MTDRRHPTCNLIGGDSLATRVRQSQSRLALTGPDEIAARHEEWLQRATAESQAAMRRVEAEVQAIIAAARSQRGA